MNVASKSAPVLMSLSAASSLVSERLAVRSGADGGARRRLSQSRPRVLRVGNIGLHQAVERYDGRRGTRFSVYARHWIRKEISEAINDRAPMSRIPAGRLVRLRAALDAVGSSEQLDTESRRVHRLRSHVSLDSRRATDPALWSTWSPTPLPVPRSRLSHGRCQKHWSAWSNNSPARNATPCPSGSV